MRLIYKNCLIEKVDIWEIKYFIYDDILLYIDSILNDIEYDSDEITDTLSDAKAYIDIITNKK